PSPNWQPNVAGDPHGIGVPGAYFRSHGNSGNGDWFYLELIPGETTTIEHPAVTCDDEEEQEYWICVQGWDTPRRVGSLQDLNYMLEHGAKLWTGGECWPKTEPEIPDNEPVCVLEPETPGCPDGPDIPEV